MAKSTPAFQGIGKLDDYYLYDALSVVPDYDTRVADVIGRTIRCIHGLEDLHRSAFREELEVYLGRASESTLASRWRDHSKDPRHTYGAVLFTCSGDRAKTLEGVAVRVLRRLKARQMLCVGNSNVHSGSPGGEPRRGERAIIYMTWKKSKTTSWEKPGVADIREIAQESAIDDVKPKQIETGLAALKRMSEREDLHWWEP